ncbi:MAG: type I DNA topoisomerase [Bacteroidia bacterium]|nr:type I DNA topoisomerase [Bacteroidota bacterium]MBK9424093.1 type I DNA topoisomerase [Bacteroidota bacterium]MBP9082935.1 type I DNA topoisomerase [Bacteroidia bacterium]
MADNLVIVESPAKAKTIEGFLGKDFVVKSSYGHVRDLAKSDKAIDIENNFLPKYEISEDKKAVIAELTRLTKSARTVWLATDEDREGEAISWHLFETLKLKESNTKRIVFHEITKPAIMSAIQNPRKIDKHLVDAQQARRILDRLVGFELSPILWKKIKPSLSAGRVQSVAVRLIVERERDVESHQTASSFKVVAIFMVEDGKGGKSVLKAELPNRFKTKDEAEAFLETCKGAKFTISNLEKKPAKKSPSAPFTTSTLQQEASRKLSFSVAQTMLIAQKLYESGKITYMRTDSVNLSQTAIDAAKAEITKQYGPQYSNPRQYKTKSASAQEAHEAIRPSYFEQSTVDGDYNEKRLYELIWKRSIASQMSDAQLEKTIVSVATSNSKDIFTATGEVVKFDGFLTVYMESSDDENTDDAPEGLLPPLNVGQVLQLNEITATEKFTYPPARYTEASLVKKLEELGIGRPSTYAPTISTIQKRGYVIKEDRQGRERNVTIIRLKNNQLATEVKTEITGAEKSKMFPTDIGTVVNDFLVENFKVILDYNFTAQVEKEFDEIAEGKIAWSKMIGEFYKPFHKTVEHTEKNTERATGERILGKDPVSGKIVSARIGRFGPLVQMRVDENDEKPQYAKLRSDQRLETITLEMALDLFKMPRNLGDYEEKEVVIGIGRFGPFVRHNSMFVSIPKTDDPYTIDIDRAIELIEAKRKSDSEKTIKLFDENPEVKVLKGRWGPYIVFGKKNIKIPKDLEPEKITYADCVRLEKDTPDAPKGRFGRFAKKNTDTKAAPAKTAPKKAAAKKKTAAKKSAPAKKVAGKPAPAKVAAAPSRTAVKKAAPAKKVAPAKKTATAKKTAPAKKAAKPAAKKKSGKR